jgi:outer membrane protein assembly factor BamD
MARLAPVLAILLAGPLVAMLGGCAAHTLPEITSESQRLDTAQQMMRKRQYLDAIELLKSYIQRNAGTAQVDGAICMLGQCYLDTRDWTLAQDQFEKLLRDYPESDSAGSASYLLGEAMMGQSRPLDFDQQFTQKAIDQWDDYLRRFPDHWRKSQAERQVLDARSRLAVKLVDTGNLYVKLRQWDPARVYYQRVVDDYRETVPSADAEIGLAVVDAHHGKLADAIAELKDLEQRFPGRPAAAHAAAQRRKLERELAKQHH